MATPINIKERESRSEVVIGQVNDNFKTCYDDIVKLKKAVDKLSGDLYDLKVYVYSLDRKTNASINDADDFDEVMLIKGS